MFETVTTKVDKNGKAESCCAEIVEGLGSMNVGDSVLSLEFKNNLIVHEDIGKIVADHAVMELYLDWNLCPCGNSRFFEHDHQGIFVDLFQKSRTKFRVYLHRRTNYLVRKIFIEYFFLFHICAIRVIRG